MAHREHRPEQVSKASASASSIGNRTDGSAAELISADLGEKLDWRHTVYQDLFKTIHGYVKDITAITRLSG